MLQVADFVTADFAAFRTGEVNRHLICPLYFFPATSSTTSAALGDGSKGLLST